MSSIPTHATPSACPTELGRHSNAHAAEGNKAPFAFSEHNAPHLADDDPDDEVMPFHWWRTRSPEAFSGADEHALSQALARTAILDEPRWAQARQGIYGPAVEMALQILPHVRATPVIDLILSALLLCAMRGDSRAAFVMILALRTLGYRADSPLPRAWRDVIVREAVLCRSASARGARS